MVADYMHMYNIKITTRANGEEVRGDGRASFVLLYSISYPKLKNMKF